MLFWLIGCFQVDETEWDEWKEVQEDAQNTIDPYFTQDATIAPTGVITTGLTLICSASAADGSGGSLIPTYVWKVGNDEVGSGETYILTPDDTDVGDTITCIASIPVGEGETTTQTSVVIENTPPSFTETAEIDPNEDVKIGSALHCSARATDIDDDAELLVAYRWLVEGADIGVEDRDYTVSGENAGAGDTITCEASVTDENGATEISSADVTLENTAPFVNNVQISSEIGPYNNAVMVCSANVFDPDEEGIAPSFSWMKGGSSLGVTEATIDLTGLDVLPNQTISCVASAADSEGDTGSDSTSVSIQNRPPAVTVGLSNQNPEADSILSCNASVEDPDGENLSLNYLWDVDGSNVGTAPNLDLGTVSNVLVGSVARCTASVSDNYGGSDSQFASGTIQNTFPVFTAQAEITESVATVVSELTCSASGEDLNDGVLFPTYEWYNGLNLIGTGASIQLDSGLVSVGDTVECVAILTDNNAGFADSTDSILIENAAPSFTQPVGISLGPTVYTNDVLICSAVADDPEDGAISTTFTWEVNGSVVFTGTNYTIDSGNTDVGDTISCTGVAEDSEGETVEDTVSVVIGNTPPVMMGTTISLQSGDGNYNNSIYFCNSTGLDPDGGSVTSSYEWFSGWDGLNPVLLGSSSMYSANQNSLMPGDVLTCVITGTDEDGGSTTDEIDVSIQNREPSAPTDVAITPLSGSVFAVIGSNLNCAASGSVDPDGETPTYTYSWQSDAGTTVSSDVLDASNTAVGDFWTCEAQAQDASSSSGSVTSEIKITDSCNFGFCDYSITASVVSSQVLEFAMIPAGWDPTTSYELTNDFYMMTTEVTQAMFLAVTGHESHENSSTGNENGVSYGIGNNYPAFYVDWHMATYFANAMTEHHNTLNGTSLNECYICSIDINTGAPQCTKNTSFPNPYDCDGYRLPSEAEWEYAARAGAVAEFWTPEGGGDPNDGNCDEGTEIAEGSPNPPALNDYAWWCGNSDQANSGSFGAKEVAQKLPNGFGLYDMHGNVQELTNDVYGDPSTCPTVLTGTDPYCLGLLSNTYTVRGGHWFTQAAALGSSYRLSANGTSQEYFQGFRIVLNQ